MHGELRLRRDRSPVSRPLLSNHLQDENPHANGIESRERRSASWHHRDYQALAKHLRRGKKLINFLQRLSRLWLARLSAVPCPWWQA